MKSRHTIAVGPAALEAAALIRQRRAAEEIRVDSPSTVVDLLRTGMEGAAFVVTEARQTSPSELLAIAAAAANGSPGLELGIIRARGAGGLRRAASRVPRLPRVAPAGGAQHLLIGADQPLSLRGARLARGFLAGGGEASEAALTTPSELCYIVGHANAMHVCLDGVVMCRRSTAAVAEDNLRVYPCFHGDPCHFGAARGDRELSADRVRARRIVSLACFGATGSDLPFASEYSVGEGLLTHAGVETAVMTLRAASVTSADLALLYYLLNAGTACGLAANRVNGFRQYRGEAAELVCLGDPESRLGETLEEVSCYWKDSRVTIEPGDSAGAPRDLVATVHPGPLPAQPVLLDDTAGAVLGAVLDPHGSLYVSIPDDWKAQPIRFRIVDRRDLADVRNTARTLLDDSEFLDLYLPLVEESNGTSPELAAATAALRQLRELLRAWPLLDLPLYLPLEERRIETLWREVRRLVDDLGVRLVALYRRLMSADQRTHPTPWDSRIVTVAAVPAVLPCGYCGKPIEEFHTQARLGRCRRTWGLCRDSCAYVYDGDPTLGRWIESPDVLVAGMKQMLGLTTRNPYGVPLEIQAVAVLKHFDRDRNQLTSPGRVELEPDAVARVPLELYVPEDFVNGTYHLSACLVVGARVNFFRAQLPVRRPGITSIVPEDPQAQDSPSPETETGHALRPFVHIERRTCEEVQRVGAGGREALRGGDS